jgi:arylsulfatase A-like enzyme
MIAIGSETAHVSGLRAAKDLLLWAVLAGAVTGLVEGSVLQVRDALGYIPWVSSEIGWRAPLVYAVLLGLASLPLALVVHRWPTTWRYAAVIPFALAAVGFIFFLARYQLHVLTQVLLAVGIGYQLARVADRVRGTSRRMVRMAIVLCAIAGTVNLGAVRVAIAREADSAEIPADSTERPPNVMLVVLDAVRARSTGLYGSGRSTSPSLDRYGQGGVVFDQAFTTASWTLPSHASMFTGRWPHETKAGWQRAVPDSVLSIAELLQSSGYRTGGFTGNLIYTTRSSGLSQGFMVYEDFKSSLEQFLLAPALGQLIRQQQIGFRSLRRLSDRKYSGTVTDGFLDWVGTGTSTPFFAFLNLYDAHAPYPASAAWVRRFSSGDRGRDRYEASIAAQDSVFGAMLDSLERRGLLSNTIVIVTADHGELLGEHDLHGHGNSLYVDELRVPLVIWGPGIPVGRRIAEPVSLRDLAATIARLAGADPSRFPGTDLSSLWGASAVAVRPSPAFAEIEPPPNVDEDAPLAEGPMRSLIWGTWHAIERGDGELEIYNMATDPAERHNRAKESTVTDTLRILRQQLESMRSRRR